MPTPDIAHVHFMASHRIPTWGRKTDSLFQTVFFGANDATPPNFDAKKHVPIAQYCANIISILTHPTVLAHAPCLILITPPPVDEYQRPPIPGRPDEERTRSAARTKLYADAAKEVGAELGVPVCDLWDICG